VGASERDRATASERARACKTQRATQRNREEKRGWERGREKWVWETGGRRDEKRENKKEIRRVYVQERARMREQRGGIERERER